MKNFSFVLIAVLSASAFTAPVRADEDQVKADEQLLKSAEMDADANSLMEFFRQRTLTDDEKIKILLAIERLGSNSFRVREKATAQLIKRGPVVIEMLRKALVSPPDLEVAIRAEKCIEKILANDHAHEVTAAAARLLGERKPKGAADVLLDYLPYADNVRTAEAARSALKTLAKADDQSTETLLKAIKDANPLIRGAAGEALVFAKNDDAKKNARKLLKDVAPAVRFRVARALTLSRDDEGIPTLIAALPHISWTEALEAENVLMRVADNHKPPSVYVARDKASREKSRAAWAEWWKSHGDSIDLAKVEFEPRMLGYTTVVLLDLGRVMELDKNNRVRWQIDGLSFPLDVQVLPNDHLLSAEYHAYRVTERNTKGGIVWQYRLAGGTSGPLVAQRLKDGNTFITTDSQMIEVDKDSKRVFNFSFPNGEKIRKASKLDNGTIVCLRDDSQVVVLTSTGKELRKFPVELSRPLFGGRIDMQRNGRVLVPHHAENKVAEYDVNGKVIWEVKVQEPVGARRLPNGNTLVTTMSQNRAIEFDRAGNEVWQYRTSTRVTRALRR